ncbi:hypothetical protein [Paraglaciecola marina]|uniref:hypothetical protein n=1 Tax=Paraglaciecola marina TaxID=2500157 RepID=UPI00105B5D81|nr:hypothetical protein [Paraglaciecola marina]
MKQRFTLEKLTKTDVIDDVVEAETAEEALALQFGGNAKDYYPCISMLGNDALYCTECNGVYEMYAKYNKS